MCSTVGYFFGRPLAYRSSKDRVGTMEKVLCEQFIEVTIHRKDPPYFVIDSVVRFRYNEKSLPGS